ncbi:MAG: hypothetical protein ACRBBN_00285 [Methyloligellaceae bacterium]
MRARRETKNDLYYFVNNATNQKIPGPKAPWAWALFIAPLYFLYWRAWKHALLSTFLYAATFGFAGLAYAIFARRILENAYLLKGWRIVNLNENQRTWVKRNAPTLPWIAFLSMSYILIRTGWSKVGHIIFEKLLIPRGLVSSKTIQISGFLELSLIAPFYNLAPHIKPATWYYIMLVPTIAEGTAFCLLAVSIAIFLEERTLQYRL